MRYLTFCADNCLLIIPILKLKVNPNRYFIKVFGSDLIILVLLTGVEPAPLRTGF